MKKKLYPFNPKVTFEMHSKIQEGRDKPNETNVQEKIVDPGIEWCKTKKKMQLDSNIMIELNIKYRKHGPEWT